MPRGREHAHVSAGFGNEHLGGLGREPGDADQKFPGEAKEGHRVLDPRIEASDIGAVSVDAVQEQPGHERVMLSEPAHQGTVDLSNPRAIFAGSPPRFTWSRVTYEAYVVSRTSARPQVDSALRADRTLRPAQAHT